MKNIKTLIFLTFWSPFLFGQIGPKPLSPALVQEECISFKRENLFYSIRNKEIRFFTLETVRDGKHRKKESRTIFVMPSTGNIRNDWAAAKMVMTYLHYYQVDQICVVKDWNQSLERPTDQQFFYYWTSQGRAPAGDSLNVRWKCNDCGQRDSAWKKICLNQLESKQYDNGTAEVFDGETSFSCAKGEWSPRVAEYVEEIMKYYQFTHYKDLFTETDLQQRGATAFRVFILLQNTPSDTLAKS